MKTVDLSETIAASDLKVSRSGPKVMYIQKLKPDFLRNYGADLNQILYESFQGQGNENLMTRCWSHDQDGRHAHIW